MRSLNASLLAALAWGALLLSGVVLSPLQMEHNAGAFLSTDDGFGSALLVQVCALGVAALLMPVGGGTHAQITRGAAARHPAAARGSQSSYYQGENSRVIWCKLRLRSSASPG